MNHLRALDGSPKVESKVEDTQPEKSDFPNVDSSTMKYRGDRGGAGGLPLMMPDVVGGGFFIAPDPEPSNSRSFDSSANAIPFWRVYRRVHIHIVNQTDRPMYLHCYSQMDDFGFYNLTPNNMYDVSFRYNLFSISGKHFCEVRDLLRHKSRTVTAYDLYDDRLLNSYCGNFRVCEWIVRDDGLWIHNLNTGTYYFGENWASDVWVENEMDQHHLFNIISPQAIQF
ncbi:hypothetical protein ACFE04_009489 [Oxalis oulophora]